MENSYKQKTKKLARHKMIRKAVELLTQNREELCCVRKTYVRDIYEEFLSDEESLEQKEASYINDSYIRMWENIHTQYVGHKEVKDLTVCYLAGPEPENDFNEFISMGVLPYNIWAFESEKHIYSKALESIDKTDFFQPKLIKTSIERFFENTPKAFDIVYIDACCPLISEQHALRCIAAMFKYHRLSSPGILLSNFAGVDEENKDFLSQYYDLIAKYNVIKKYPKCSIILDKSGVGFENYYDTVYEDVKKHFDQYYGDFVTYMICNAASVTIPALRFVNSNYLLDFSTQKPSLNRKYNIRDVNMISNNTLLKFFATNELLVQSGEKDKGIKRIKKLEMELSASTSGYSLLQALQKIYEIGMEDERTNFCEYLDFFENPQNLHQFLDKPTRKIFIDSMINQLSCPMHYCTDKIERISYIAKKTKMYMDLIPFDECRYIYDWLPSMDQMKNAFSNKSWQYVYRFALDGLVKNRLNYNNEFFFQGTVISKKIKKFKDYKIKERQYIYGG